MIETKTIKITEELFSGADKILAYEQAFIAYIKKGMSRQEAAIHARHEVLHALADFRGTGFFTLITENNELTATGYQPIGSRTTQEIDTIAKAPGKDMSQSDLHVIKLITQK